MVGALRALGFTARHVGGSGTPDGVAEYMIHGIEEKSFTLEAKSSADVPSLPQLDFAGLRSHYESHHAHGCLLVAPAYPGADNINSEVSMRALQQKVSCWTIEQLARVVEAAERRHINARRIQEVVLGAFPPAAVELAVNRLVSEPNYDKVDLYGAVLAALADLEPRLRETPRNVSMLATEISRNANFGTVSTIAIREAVSDLARASSGMLHIAEDDDVFVLGALDELRRRVASITGRAAPPRRRGTFLPEA